MDNLTITGKTDGRRSRRSDADDRARISGVVAALFDIAPRTLRTPSRGCAAIALARQMAMYLARVELGMTLSEAGRLFGRDRTTAAHACRLIEDMRDDPRLDTLLSVLEEMVRDRSVRSDADAAQ